MGAPGPQSALFYDAPATAQPELRFDEDGANEGEQGGKADEPGGDEDLSLLN
jgi:hypothetical protein